MFSTVSHCLYVTITAKGLSVGDRVCASATKVLGTRKATTEFGKQKPVIENTLARPAPSDNPLVVDAIQWTAVDAITANHFDGNIHSMRILWGDDAHISRRSVYDFFLMMFPTHMLAEFAIWKSTVLKDVGQAETSPQEVLKVLGFLYGMTVHPYGDRRRYWSVENSEDSLSPAPASMGKSIWYGAN